MSTGRLGPETELFRAGDNGHPLRTAFITQNVDGHLLTGLTTRQSIVYASRLKRVVAKKKKDGQSSADDHATVAERLATEMALSSVLDVRVESLSGGERKRVRSFLESLIEFLKYLLSFRWHLRWSSPPRSCPSW